jgi:hypothetical protein
VPKVVSENEKIVASPVLKCAPLESVFKLPHPDTTKVILNIISTKYRQRLQADSSFEHSFSEQRLHLAQAFHQSHIAYIDQKAAVDALASSIDGDDNSQFCTGLVALHNQLLQLYLANISLQSIISDLLLTDNESEEELENNKRLIEDELKANAQLAEKIKPTQKKSKRRTKVMETAAPLPPPPISSTDDDDGSTGSFCEIKPDHVISNLRTASDLGSSKGDSEKDVDKKREKREKKEREKEERHAKKEEDRLKKEQEKRERKERELKDKEKEKEREKDRNHSKEKDKEKETKKERANSREKRDKKDKEKDSREKDSR